MIARVGSIRWVIWSSRRSQKLPSKFGVSRPDRRDDPTVHQPRVPGDRPQQDVDDDDHPTSDQRGEHAAPDRLPPVQPAEHVTDPDRHHHRDHGQQQDVRGRRPTSRPGSTAVTKNWTTLPTPAVTRQPYSTPRRFSPATSYGDRHRRAEREHGDQRRARAPDARTSSRTTGRSAARRSPAAAIPRTIQRRRDRPADHRPPREAAEHRQDQRRSPSPTSGSSYQSLTSIARYCLSSTATQKTGREKNRNAEKVIV